MTHHRRFTAPFPGSAGRHLDRPMEGLGGSWRRQLHSRAVLRLGSRGLFWGKRAAARKGVGRMPEPQRGDPEGVRGALGQK